MPVLTSGPAGVTDLAARLVSDLNSGRAARQSFGSRAAAFEWAAGLPNILARHVNSAVVEGRSFTATRVKPSATPAAKVLPGAVKPTAVDITTSQENLSKYAGLASFQTEQAIDTDGLVPALASVISTSCLMAYDADCGAALTAGNGLTAGGADWPSAVLGGIAAVAGAGGAPGILAIGAADYAEAVQSPGVGYAMDPTSGVPALFGLAIVLTAGIAAGSGFVLDPAAVLATENQDSPFVVVDPYGSLDTNVVRIAVEAFLGFVVTSPGGVCEVTVAPAEVMAASSSSGKSSK